MIFDIYYNLIYCSLFLCTLLIYIYYDLFKKKSSDLNFFILFSFILLLIFVVGFRDFKVGVDTENYATNIQQLTEMLEGKDPGFISISVFFHWLASIRGVIFLYAASFYGVFLAFITRYERKNALLLLFIFSSFFFFKSLSINIIRQGISISFILLAFSLLIQKKHTHALFWFFVGVSVHLTSVVFFIIYIIQRKIIKLKTLLLLFFSSIILSFLGVGFHSVAILGGYGDELTKFDKLAEEFGYKIGFRPDFVLFNTLFFLLGIYIYKNKLEKKERLFVVLKFYVLTSVVFFLSFYFPYSDRMGIISWIFIPLILFEIPETPIKYLPFKYSLTIFFSFILFWVINMIGM